MLFHIDSAKSALEKKKRAEKIHKIIEVDLSAFVYRLFHEDFSFNRWNKSRWQLRHLHALGLYLKKKKKKKKMRVKKELPVETFIIGLTGINTNW